MAMGRYVILYFLVICFSGCASQEPGSFTISGEMKGLEDGMVRLYTYPPSNLLLDSCEVKDGKYSLRGKLENSQLAMLIFDINPEKYRTFVPMVRIFLEPSDIRIYHEFEDPKKSQKIEGSLLNDRLMICEAHIKSLPEFKRAGELNDQIQLAFHKADMVAVRSMSQMRDSLYGVLIDELFRFEKDADKSEVVACLASQYASPLPAEEVQKVTERFDPVFRSSYYVAQMAEYASKEQELTVGKLLPDFQVKDKDGKIYTLADFRGKYLFLEFSASWCGWCKKETPYIRKAYAALKDKNIAFVTMMMDTEREQWLGDMEKGEIEWWCFSDLLGMKKSPMVKAYNLRGLPDSFVIDPEGYIIRRDLRGNEVLDYLSSVVN